MKKYKAVIMDFDLTIADTAFLIEDCLYSNAARYGYDLDRKILRDGIGMTAETIYLDAGVDPDMARKLDIEYFNYSAQRMREQTEFFPGVTEGLHSLYERGITLSILSLKSSDHIRTPLERKGIDRYIDSVIGPDDISAHKPDPAGIFLIAEKKGLSLEDILYVGDSVTDLKTAQNAGVDFAAVCTGAISAEKFAEMGAGMIYPSFAEMCVALCEKI